MTNSEIIAPYFKPTEFTCDGKPALENMNPAFLEKLVRLRDRCGFAFVLNSTYRSPSKNKRVGGAQNSMHVQGRAVDIMCISGAARWEIVRHATEMGLSVGIMERAIHVDDRETPICFHYYDKYTRK